MTTYPPHARAVINKVGVYLWDVLAIEMRKAVRCPICRTIFRNTKEWNMLEGAILHIRPDHACAKKMETGCVCFFCFFPFLVTGTLSPLRQMHHQDGTQCTWFEPEQRPRKRVPKRSVHGKQTPQAASKTSLPPKKKPQKKKKNPPPPKKKKKKKKKSKTSWRQDDQP